MMPRNPRRTVYETATPSPRAPEHLRAKWWRVHVARLTQAELAARIGLSVRQVRELETGRERNQAAWHRYRLLCAALAAGTEHFNWS